MAYLLGSLELGTVKKESVNVDAQLFDQPLPRNPPSATILLDLFGSTKIINLSGVFVTGTNGYTIQTFVQQFLNILDGSQDSTLTYSSETVSSSVEVVVKSFGYDYEEGNPSAVNYALQLQEGTGVS